MSELPSRADLKAELAAMDQTLAPDATFKKVTKPTGPASVIILDRVVKGTEPDYCIHGYASCVRCDYLCWLGHETVKVCESGEAFGLCRDCAQELAREGVIGKPTSRVEDHKRADGPHE